MTQFLIMTLLLIGVCSSMGKPSNPTKIQDLSHEDVALIAMFHIGEGQGPKNIKSQEADTLKYEKLSKDASRYLFIAFWKQTVMFGELTADSKVGTHEQREKMRALTKKLKSQKKLLETGTKTKELKPFFNTLLDISYLYDEIGGLYSKKEISRLVEELDKKGTE